jgi:hypothetical protein
MHLLLGSRKNVQLKETRINESIIDMFVGLCMFNYSTNTTLKSCSFAWSRQNSSCLDSTNTYRSLYTMDFTFVQWHIHILRVDFFELLKWEEILLRLQFLWNRNFQMVLLTTRGCRKITKFVLLKDDDGESVAFGVCHSVSLDLVGSNEGPLGLNKVVVQITNLLVMENFWLNVYTPYMEYLIRILWWSKFVWSW